MKSMKRTIAILVAVSLIVGCAIGGAMAWLTAKTDTVVNTFTVGNINITLDESKLKNDGVTLDPAIRVYANSFKMVPGNVIDKDPTVTVKANSEDCWLFIKVNESDNLDSFLTYDVITGNNTWTALELENEKGVYYRTVAASNVDQPFDVIYYDEDADKVCDIGEENKVFVKTSVTKEMMDEIEEGTASTPALTFTAYAIQSTNLTDQNNDTVVDEKDAWILANPAA